MSKLSLNNLRPAHGARRTSKRLGRGGGSGKGTTAGKGTKGQRARQGGRKGLRALGMKYLIQATPKLGGFASIHAAPAALPVRVLNRFPAGTTVSVRTLADSGLIGKNVREVKLVGDAKVTRKLQLVKIGATESAKKSIEAAGGSISA